MQKPLFVLRKLLLSTRPYSPDVVFMLPEGAHSGHNEYDLFIVILVPENPS